jgi:tetratricopeptide (TPR) repeat protein
MSKTSVSDHFHALGQSFLSLLQSPEAVPGYILETFSTWRKSRNWVLVAMGTIFSVAVLLFLGVALLAAFRSDSSVVHTCLSEADKRIPQVELERLAFDEHYIRNEVRRRMDPDMIYEEPEEDLDGLKRSILTADIDFSESLKFRQVELLLRHALSVRPESSQSLYRLALLTSIDFSKENRIDEAEKLMKEIAGKEGEASSQAHAWLATTLIGKYQRRESFELDVLEKHLSQASHWKLVEPELLNYYSEICRATGKLEKALEISKQASSINPKFNLSYARICKELGPAYAQEMKRAAEAAEQAYQPRRGTALETDIDRRALADSLILQDRRDVAIEILEERISDTEEEHTSVRHALAEIFVQMFFETNQETFAILREVAEGKRNDKPDAKIPKIDWKRLEEAAKLDPLNPYVGQIIAVQVRMWHQFDFSPELRTVLANQIRENKATAAARNELAILYLIKGRIQDAKREWAKILEIDPNFVDALNNLAVFLCREEPPQLEKAIEYAMRAASIQPNNLEVCDTVGDVLLRAGSYTDAIANLEKVIRADPFRIDSRRRLAECYEKMGMSEMAQEQNNRIDRIQEQKRIASEKEEEKARAEAKEKARRDENERGSGSRTR